uniref:Uncharacterized protein n=1 Tax=Cyclophora tenuis TaxID=216820 RepID=A0A7S1DCC6_CYCTE
MLAMYRTMKQTGIPVFAGFTIDEIVQKGCKYFKDAIDAGEVALAAINEEEGWSTNYLIFMQQLSNRYFNRAMFLLTVRGDHPQPDDAKSQGLMDLSTCKDMDREVVDNGEREGFKGSFNEYFELLLSRIRGMLTLIKLGCCEEDEWGLEELFEDARVALMGALDEPKHALFVQMEPAGQMQRLDFALIDYLLTTSPLAPTSSQEEEAARIAIRMLVEDEYVIGEAGSVALKALIDRVKGMSADELGGEDPSDVQAKLFQYRHKVTEAISLQFSKSEELRRASYYACNAGDFTMEFF